MLTFDPERGYASEAKAFGASFAEHAMSGARDILEYGFTGRQLNVAYCLARRDLAAWRERASGVIEFFVTRMAAPSGWVHTLFDTRRNEPVFACGDPRGVVMHYLGAAAISGTYTRMMAEAGSDLLLCVELPGLAGDRAQAWLGICQRLANFFVRVQNSDGSWFRAYAPDGTPIVGGDWFGEPEDGARTATSAVVPYLLAVAAHGDPDGKFCAAALRAGRFVLRRQVAPAEFRGGTLAGGPTVEIDILSNFTPDVARGKVLDKLIKEFNAQHEGEYMIVSKAQPDWPTLQKQIRSLISAGKTPDLFLYNFNPADLSREKSGQLMDWSAPLSEDVSWKDRFSSNNVADLSIDGKLIGIVGYRRTSHRPSSITT